MWGRLGLATVARDHFLSHAIVCQSSVNSGTAELFSQSQVVQAQEEKRNVANQSWTRGGKLCTTRAEVQKCLFRKISVGDPVDEGLECDDPICTDPRGRKLCRYLGVVEGRLGKSRS